MYTGERLTLSDLFEKDTDFIKQLNAAIKTYTEETDDLSQSIELLRPFGGIKMNFENFSLMEAEYDFCSYYTFAVHLNLYFNKGDNSYFDGNHIVMVSPRQLDEFLVRTQRDMNGLLPADSPVYLLQFAYEDNILRMERIGEYSNSNEQDTYGQRRWLDITGYAGADKINAARYKYISENYDIYEIDEACTDASIEKYYDAYTQNYVLKEGEPLTREMLKNCYVEINSDITFIGDQYVIARNYARAAYSDLIGYGDGIEWGVTCFVYDLETGEEIMFDDILSEGWRDSCIWYDSTKVIYFDDITVIKTPDSKLTFTGIILCASGRNEYIFNIIDKNGIEVTAMTGINLFKW